MNHDQIIDMSPQFTMSNEVCLICKNKYRNSKGMTVKKKGIIWLSDSGICYDCWHDGHFGSSHVNTKSNTD